jgi:hypothetical protein
VGAGNDPKHALIAFKVLAENDARTNTAFCQAIQMLIKGLADENKSCTLESMVGLGDEDSRPGHFGNAMK